MLDEQTTPERGGVRSKEAPATDSSNEAFVGQRKPSSGRLADWWATWVVLVVLVLVIGSFVYPVDITLHPDSGPEGFKVRHVASAAEKHLSKDPNAVSVTVINALIDVGGTETDLGVHLEDDTSTDAVANLLTSTRAAAFDENSPDTNINLRVTLPWTLHGTSIKTTYDCTGHPDLLHIARRDLTTTGEAKTIDITGGRLNIDYGQVTAIPTTFLQPSAPRSTKTLTMNGWRVTSISNTGDQFSNPPFDRLITATGQASPTGTTDLDNSTLSAIGLVTDDTKDLIPEVTTPVVRTVVDCQSTGLTIFQLNNWATDTSSVTNPWPTFTCNNGTWIPQHNGNTNRDEAAILSKTAEL